LQANNEPTDPNSITDAVLNDTSDACIVQELYDNYRNFLELSKKYVFAGGEDAPAGARGKQYGFDMLIAIQEAVDALHEDSACEESSVDWSSQSDDEEEEEEEEEEGDENGGCDDHQREQIEETQRPRMKTPAKGGNIKEGGNVRSPPSSSRRMRQTDLRGLFAAARDKHGERSLHGDGSNYQAGRDGSQ
jgi:hypothetical protein